MAGVNWSTEGCTYNRVNRELAQELSEQFASLESQSSMSLQECLRLLEDTFPLSQESQLSEEEGLDMRGGGVEHPSPGREPLLSPLLTHEDPLLDLEQQWQDLLAIMEPEDMDVDAAVATPFLGSGSDDTTPAEPRPNPVQQDVSLHQASLPADPEEGSGPLRSSGDPQEPPHPAQPALLTLPPSTPDSVNISAHARDPVANGTTGDPMTSDLFPEEDPALPSPLASLLDDSTMFDEISLLALALEEGFSPALASRLEDELDSDSGLSLNFSHVPASPSSSEASYSSSSSSSSSASTVASLFSEEGAVGYSSDVAAEGEEEGGFSTDLSKISPLSFRDPESFNRLPWLQHVGHDHTYNQQRPAAAKTQKGLRPHLAKPYEHDASDRMWGRDERRARGLKIPFSNERIVNLPVEEFNDLLAEHRLTDAQLTLVRDIRRRGKNKMAAQNCRRRKLDVLVDLEAGVSGLRRHRARLLREKTEALRSIQAMKQRVSGLYQEVFSRLRDDEGRPLAAAEYALQFGSDGRVLVAQRRQGSAGEPNRRPSKKQERRKK
ncbi:endoplasmic reticulum membrane sensor NFE2L1-like [Osmerus eperlanus]|uniref:endoplasmic reticulum membrane sensor NFE2L1-like n=1 Tax=Osmerus eperlanus TaxID=29151 RepID=UPI002E14D4BD